MANFLTVVKHYLFIVKDENINLKTMPFADFSIDATFEKLSHIMLSTESDLTKRTGQISNINLFEKERIVFFKSIIPTDSKEVMRFF